MCFSVVDIAVEGPNLCWEKMDIGFGEECWFRLPPGVFVFVIYGNKDGCCTGPSSFRVMTSIASEDER